MWSGMICGYVDARYCKKCAEIDSVILLKLHVYSIIVLFATCAFLQCPEVRLNIISSLESVNKGEMSD